MADNRSLTGLRKTQSFREIKNSLFVFTLSVWMQLERVLARKWLRTVLMRTGCVDYDKAEFLDAIDDIRSQTFKPSTILSAFRQTGLVPYNPDVVLAKMREAACYTPGPGRRARDAKNTTHHSFLEASSYRCHA
jgi:hypothetical protein